MGDRARVHTHGVVESRLDVSRTVRRRAVKIRNAERKGLDPAFEIGTDGRRKDAEFVFRRGLDAEHRARGEHKRAQIQRSAAAVGRHELLVCGDRFFYGFEKFILGIHGHFQPRRGFRHALRVEVGAKTDDFSALGGVGL